MDEVDLAEECITEIKSSFQSHHKAIAIHDYEGAKKISISILILARTLSILFKITEPNEE